MLLLWVNGCAPAISKEIRSQVDPTTTFKAVFHDPDAYKGRMALWGGEIIHTRNTKDETWIELLQHPLAGNDRPNRAAVSEGRFLIRHDGFLDPAVYGRGREITVAGEIQGRKIQPMDEIEYNFPVVSDKELVLWGPQHEPTIHVGLGFGAMFGR
jgi:outer membrane lipoprotein